MYELDVSVFSETKRVGASLMASQSTRLVSGQVLIGTFEREREFGAMKRRHMALAVSSPTAPIGQKLTDRECLEYRHLLVLNFDPGNMTL